MSADITHNGIETGFDLVLKGIIGEKQQDSPMPLSQHLLPSPFFNVENPSSSASLSPFFFYWI